MPSPVRLLARRLALPLLALLLAGSLLAGCGGGDDDGPRALSKREYIERSNALQGEAAEVFASLEGPTVATPAQATRYLQALDDLIAGLADLRPPQDWRDEHARLLTSARTMRESMAVVSRASARKPAVIATQLQRSADAQREFEQAVRDINASR